MKSIKFLNHLHVKKIIRPITAMTACEQLGMVATGTSDGKIHLWQIEKLALDSELESVQDEIADIVFLYPYSGLCVADKKYVNRFLLSTYPSTEESSIFSQFDQQQINHS
jgi:hypothetical protein